MEGYHSGGSGGNGGAPGRGGNVFFRATNSGFFLLFKARTEGGRGGKGGKGGEGGDGGHGGDQGEYGHGGKGGKACPWPTGYVLGESEVEPHHGKSGNEVAGSRSLSHYSGKSGNHGNPGSHGKNDTSIQINGVVKYALVDSRSFDQLGSASSSYFELNVVGDFPVYDILDKRTDKLTPNSTFLIHSITLRNDGWLPSPDGSDLFVDVENNRMKVPLRSILPNETLVIADVSKGESPKLLQTAGSNFQRLKSESY